MSYARARKHYRAAQSLHACEKGIFIPEDKKPRLFAFAVIAALVLFIQGILLGLLVGRE